MRRYAGRTLAGCLAIDDFEAAARRRLPRPLFDLIAGGAGDERTVRRNRTAFRQFALMPRVLADVTYRDTSTTVLGTEVSLPVLLAPAGYAGMLDPQGELAVARAAAREATVYALSTFTGRPLEEVARAARGPKWFQLYLRQDRAATEALVDRAQRAGFSALCLTIDAPVRASRRRDIRNGLTQPWKVTPRLVRHAALRPAWTLGALREAVVRRRLASGSDAPVGNATAALTDVGRPVTLADLRWLRTHWRGPLLVKGILHPEECRMLIDCGVDGVVVSNHGGRQLDAAPASIEVLRAVVEAVAGRAEVFVDGGFRRGSDVAIALGLGARACLVGRPYLYGLAIGGEVGVRRVLDVFRRELDEIMALLGCATVAEIDSGLIMRQAAVTCRDLGR